MEIYKSIDGGRTYRCYGKMLQRAGIEYHDGKDLKGQIVEKVLKPKLLIFFDSQFRCGTAEVSRKTENMTG